MRSSPRCDERRPDLEAERRSCDTDSLSPSDHHTAQALDEARYLAEHGVRFFLARPAVDAAGEWVPDGGHGGSGFLFPPEWQKAAKADPAVIDAWRPGWALCMVTGGPIDVVDVDARHGGLESAEANEARWPATCGRQRTPSGGWHDLVSPLGMHSATGVLPGVDVRAGVEGEGLGFVFVAPTVKLSKVTGELAPYVWESLPDLALLPAGDTSGAWIAAIGPRVPSADRAAEARHVGYDGVRVALAREVSNVDFAAPGQRNNVLNAAAFNLGQLVGPHLDEDEVRDALTEAALGAGLDPAEVAATIASGLSKGMAHPRDTTDQGDSDTPDAYERQVTRAVERLRIQEDARQRFALERQPDRAPWDLGTLADHLTKPEPPAARVEGLLPWEASTEVVAQRKTGKTTLTLDLAHGLLTGEPFLGEFPVKPVDGRVALLNFEVSGYQAAGWAQDRGIPPDRLVLVNLRGALNPFRDPQALTDLAAQLRRREVESLIVDPFGRAFGGDNQNDAGQVQGWLVALDEFARGMVGALDVILTVHAGWDGSHARGSSALEDWADSLIYLTRNRNTGRRYINADGRDVELAAHELVMDPDTRALSLGLARTPGDADEGGRARPELMEAITAALAALPDDHQGWTTNSLRREVRGNNADKDASVKALIAAGYVVATPAGQAVYHRLRARGHVFQAQQDFEEWAL